MSEPTAIFKAPGDWRERLAAKPPAPLCERCGGPAEHRCCHCDDAGRVRLLLLPGDPAFGKSVPCSHCHAEPLPDERDERLARLMRMPREYTHKRLRDWLPSNSSKRRAVESWSAAWPLTYPFLVLAGSIGTGKSHLAAGVLWRLAEEHDVYGQFWPVPELLDRYRASYNGRDDERESTADVDAAINRIPLLVLDDFGKERATDWASERLFALIDQRWRNHQATVVTTNLALREIEALGGLGSRLLDAERSQLVFFDGADQRGRRAEHRGVTPPHSERKHP